MKIDIVKMRKNLIKIFVAVITLGGIFSIADACINHNKKNNDENKTNQSDEKCEENSCQNKDKVEFVRNNMYGIPDSQADEQNGTAPYSDKKFILKYAVPNMPDGDINIEKYAVPNMPDGELKVKYAVPDFPKKIESVVKYAMPRPQFDEEKDVTPENAEGKLIPDPSKIIDKPMPMYALPPEFNPQDTSKSE